MFNEFDDISTEQLEQMLKEVTVEAEKLEAACRARQEVAFLLGETLWSHNPACDYIADDLHKRAGVIYDELHRRYTAVCEYCGSEYWSFANCPNCGY